MARLTVLLIALLYGSATAFVVQGPRAVPTSIQRQLTASSITKSLAAAISDQHEGDNVSSLAAETRSRPVFPTAITMIPALSLLFAAFPADAATNSAAAAFPSALAAYGHFVSLFIMCGCIGVERFTIRPNMSEEEFDLLTKTDILYGIAALAVTVTGYLRVVSYGKGFEYYAHEPLFWLKICLMGVLAASSFFPTTIIIKKAIDAKNSGNPPVVTEKLAARMVTILNAEATAMASIPLAATTMARGIFYNQDFYWPVEAALAAIVTGGLSYKYIKEALTFEDGDDDVVTLDE